MVKNNIKLVLEFQFDLKKPLKQTEMCIFENWKIIQSVSKKMVFCGKTAITSFKLIQNAKSGGVLENSGYLLRYGY